MNKNTEASQRRRKRLEENNLKEMRGIIVTKEEEAILKPKCRKWLEKIRGENGKQVKIDWWVNWWPSKPEELYIELVKKAHEAGLEVDDKTHLFDVE